MSLTNILIIVSAVVLILLLWIIVGVRNFKRLKREIKGQWEIVDEGLRKRHDLLPNLIETVREYDKGHEELLERMIKERTRAAKEYNPGAEKIEYEHDLSATIDEVIALGKGVKDLGTDTNFLELRKEIDGIEQNIIAQTKKYNEMVRAYNKQRNLIFLRPLAAIFGFEVMNIFEVEV
ncbi:MAG: LemA family protein [Candidatus Peregrinibacteria bacterium]